MSALLERNPVLADDFHIQLEAAKAHARHAEAVAAQSAEAVAFFKSREVDEDMPKMSAVRMAGIFKLLEIEAAE